jgi:hypothetical protein
MTTTNEYDNGYQAGYEDAMDDAMDDAQAAILGVVDTALPKCYGVCIWLRGQICKVFRELRGDK